MVSPVEQHNTDFATRAIRQAAQETGTDFNYLLRTAARESNFDVRAEAATSSAAGMFQFIEQTWLGVMHRSGAEHGYAAEASQISQDERGRFVVADPEQRQRILDLRFDAVAAARMAGELASENARVIETRTGRPASSGELYAAHFLGAQGAATLIEAAEADPATRADRLFPAAAAANRPIFYSQGRPRSVSEVLTRLTGEGEGVPAMRHAAAQAEPAVLRSRAPAEGGDVRVPAGNPAPTPVRNAVFSPHRFQVGNGELSPTLVEILASLDAPESGRVRKT